jgi:NAD-dependent dihydropyrimidine dehydrogenase PreA subunit
MAYVITDSCIKDGLCVEVCPVDCIHPRTDEPAFESASQLYINPAECIDCGACVPACPTNSVFSEDDLPPDFAESTAQNADFYARQA